MLWSRYHALTPSPYEGSDPYFGLMEDPSNLCRNRKQQGRVVVRYGCGVDGRPGPLAIEMTSLPRNSGN